MNELLDRRVLDLCWIRGIIDVGWMDGCWMIGWMLDGWKLVWTQFPRWAPTAENKEPNPLHLN